MIQHYICPNHVTIDTNVSALETHNVGLLILAFIYIMAFGVTFKADNVRLVTYSRMSLSVDLASGNEADEDSCPLVICGRFPVSFLLQFLGLSWRRNLNLELFRGAWFL